MSRSQVLPRAGGLAAIAGLAALALLALMAFAGAPRAQAAFSTQKCAGTDITGRGASFARDAHLLFNVGFKNSFCQGTPGEGSLNVTYEALGSGAGRNSVKVRTDVPRFGMTDEPPSQVEISQMNSGGSFSGTPSVFTADTNPNNDGQIHVVPAAVGAVAPLVNFPDNCDVTLLPDSAETPQQNLDNDSTPDDVIRVRFTKAQFEGIWAKDSNFATWTEVFPTLTDPGCNIPITRVVRFDESGTSFAFKDYLDTIDPAEGWLTAYGSTALGTREWPGASYANRDDCDTDTDGAGPDTGPNGVADASDPDGPGGLADGTPVNETDQLTSGCSNGNGALVARLVQRDGSVGYSDLSTARNNSPSLAITPEANDNDTYWTQIPNGSGTFTEPTADSNGFRTGDGARGSNCQSTTFTDVPTSTFGNWSQTSGVNSPAGYAICTLTYGLVFDDNADVWGTSAVEEAKARTVKDYWTHILSDGAQAALFSNDYSPLPGSIRTIATTGIASVDWNKGGGGATQPPGGVDPTPPGGNNPPPPGNTTPSNDFSIPKTEISSKNGTATIEVRLPGPGLLEMVGTAKVDSKNRPAAKKKTIKVGRTVLDANQAGTFRLTLKPSAKAKKVLKKKGSLKTNLELTFTPDGGQPSTESASVKLKLAGKK